MPRKTKVKSTDAKLKVAKRIRVHFLERKTVTNNTGPNETPFLRGIKEGAVYANLDDIQEGRLYTVVELSNGMIALNEPTAKERLQYFAELKEELGGNMSIAEIKDAMGIIN